MAKHTSYRGVTLDIDSLRRENGDAVALGNARTNARGDQIDHTGKVVKTAEQIARESHRTKTEIINTGIKGPMPEEPASPIAAKRQTVQPRPAKKTETELPSGDIIVGDGDTE